MAEEQPKPRVTTPVMETFKVAAPWEYEDAPPAAALGAQTLTRLRGIDLIRDPYLNKGTAFTERERDMLGLRGLMPPQQFDIKQQLERQLKVFRNYPSNIQKYNFLERLHTRNKTLYYRLLLENIMETMPIVYTPTVGEGCLDFSSNYRSRTTGLYFSRKDRASFREICLNWPQHQVDMIVITDGSRILGLGDIGINGMGIPIGKLALYVAAAGFHPWRTLPIVVDMGTNTQKYIDDPLYIGIQEPRPDDAEFYEIMAEIIDAIKFRWPKACIQFEDFSNEHAFGLLDEYFPKTLSFNDDIQGTASVALAGIIAALRIQNGTVADGQNNLRDQRIVFLGAGSAGCGVADLIALGMAIEAEEAGEDASVYDQAYYRKNNFWLVDSKGLVCDKRGDKLQNHKIPFSRQDSEPMDSLLEVVRQAKPHALIGLAGLDAGAFTSEIIELHSENCKAESKRPIIFALSNPTSKAECTAEQAYTLTNGQAIFCSGSPFAPVTIDGKTYKTGQGNNMYVFPGIGYGAHICHAERIIYPMFYAAAVALAHEVTEEELDQGLCYPDLKNIRQLSARVAKSVIDVAVQFNLAHKTEPKEGWLDHLISSMWWPEYQEYV